jgi:hypothetical protein
MQSEDAYHIYDRKVSGPLHSLIRPPGVLPQRRNNQLVLARVKYQFKAADRTTVGDTTMGLFFKEAMADLRLTGRTAPRHDRAVYGSMTRSTRSHKAATTCRQSRDWRGVLLLVPRRAGD